ncbi:MAG: hypothetical protein H7X80_03210 [bacterium]|nr:hypothetical protein [Candidatus Kapabacteria bacterium]
MRIRFKSPIAGVMVMLAMVAAMLVMDYVEAEARRGGSFGGRRGGSSFGSRRSTPSYSSRSTSRSTPRTSTAPRRSSFGGTRLASSAAYTKSYGVPRRTESVRAPSMGGAGMSNYNVHRYGGMSDRFMTGYLLGSTSWMWSMPFHPAFYYSRPYYATGKNGATDVYPPTFQIGKLIITLLVVGGIGYLIYRAMRRRKPSAEAPQSSFS